MQIHIHSFSEFIKLVLENVIYDSYNILSLALKTYR